MEFYTSISCNFMRFNIHQSVSKSNLRNAYGRSSAPLPRLSSSCYLPDSSAHATIKFCSHILSLASQEASLASSQLSSAPATTFILATCLTAPLTRPSNFVHSFCTFSVDIYAPKSANIPKKILKTLCSVGPSGLPRSALDKYCFFF